MKLPSFVCKVTFLLGSLEVICILLIAIRRSCIFIVLRPRDGIVHHSMSWVLIENTFIIDKLFLLFIICESFTELKKEKWV